MSAVTNGPYLTKANFRDPCVLATASVESSLLSHTVPLALYDEGLNFPPSRMQNEPLRGGGKTLHYHMW